MDYVAAAVMVWIIASPFVAVLIGSVIHTGDAS